ALPSWSADDWEALRSLDYPAVAERMLWPFVEGAMDREIFAERTADAYDFDVPIEPYAPGIHLLRLDRGPSASFKDFAARWMARMLGALRPPDAPVLTVLVATSGDTGSAVGQAFHGMSGFRVVLLFPRDEVSRVQRQQLTAIGGNVDALEIAGTFDDCQRMVKEAFLDPDLRACRLTSANSISIGRVLPQMVYYAYAWSRVCARPAGPVSFCVPSGNLGNAFGCELARRMGLPVRRLILAVNENDEVPRYLETGTYAPVSPSRKCLSNAMNVGNPSNLARFFHLFGGGLSRAGRVERAADLNQFRSHVESVAVSDADTRAMILRAWRDHGVRLEPHGAVAMQAAERLGFGPEPMVVLETAHPAKFPEILDPLLGDSPEPPPALKAVMERPSSCTPMSAEYDELKDYLRSKA
ncbi:MAG: threonine synthase, partial [Kiritimatiellae bacterium]|nr:threonine synthase [Kiritimatiellia bacterium]